MIEPKQLIEMLQPSSRSIKEEGDADFPCGKCDGVIFFGDEIKRFHNNGVQYKIAKKDGEYYRRAMRYLKPAHSDDLKLRASGRRVTLGITMPDAGFLNSLLKSNPQVRKEANDAGRNLEVILSRSRNALRYNQNDVLPFWHVYPVEEGVWAIIWHKSEKVNV